MYNGLTMCFAVKWEYGARMDGMGIVVHLSLIYWFSFYDAVFPDLGSFAWRSCHHCFVWSWTFFSLLTPFYFCITSPSSGHLEVVHPPTHTHTYLVSRESACRAFCLNSQSPVLSLVHFQILKVDWFIKSPLIPPHLYAFIFSPVHV